MSSEAWNLDEAREAPTDTWRPTTAAGGRRFRVAQRVHVGMITVVPLVGTIAALVLAFRDGVRTVDVALLVVMYSATMIGITVGFHRLLSHRAFETSGFVRTALVALGSMAAQGPPMYWVSNHRRHHQFSDQPGDPHSPRFDGQKPLSGIRGLWHAHLGWSFDHELSDVVHYCKDLFRDPVVLRVNRRYYLLVAAGVALPAVAGGLITLSLHGALLGALWGGFVRLFLTLHATNSINSITHSFGSRAFETREDSRNNVWLAIPTFGEAWHNNHHAFPRSAFFGHRLLQIDIGGSTVRLLERLHLVWDVKRPSPGRTSQRPRPRERARP